jgi:hypothetical protein
MDTGTYRHKRKKICGPEKETTATMGIEAAKIAIEGLASPHRILIS